MPAAARLGWRNNRRALGHCMPRKSTCRVRPKWGASLEFAVEGPTMTQDILFEHNDQVLLITLNRPDRLNAISGPMLNELAAGLKEANRNPAVRVVVLTGAGKGFCSGLDLKDT